MELPAEDSLGLTDIIGYLRFGLGSNPSDFRPMVLHILILMTTLHLLVLLVLLYPLPDLPLHLLQA